jgi:hypothetical protein
VQVLATHCVLKQSSDIVASPDAMLAPALNRQGTAAAAHSHACFSKGCSSIASCAPLQHLWGSKAHTQAHARAHKRTHTRAHTHAYACTCCTRDGLRQNISVASNAPTLALCIFRKQRKKGAFPLLVSRATWNKEAGRLYVSRALDERVLIFIHISIRYMVIEGHSSSIIIERYKARSRPCLFWHASFLMCVCLCVWVLLCVLLLLQLGSAFTQMP